MYWLRKRLGCAGPGRFRILQNLSLPLGDERVPDRKAVGLFSRELSSLSEDYSFSRISRAFRPRGTADELLRIAWLGSVLGDIASGGPGDDWTEIATEAALFNLGVALFDTVVDESQGKVPRLAEALRPGRLSQRLSNPSDPESALSCGDADIRLIVQLFDGALCSMGRRFSPDRAHLEHLAHLLARMYESELGQSGDPFAAKVLPVAFIGELSAPSFLKKMRLLFAALSHYLHLWDDWLDIGEDMARMAPNAFLTPSVRVPALGMLMYAGRSVARVVGGGLFHEKIAHTLYDAQEKAIEASLGVNFSTYEKTITLCRYLTGYTPAAHEGSHS